MGDVADVVAPGPGPAQVLPADAQPAELAPPQDAFYASEGWRDDCVVCYTRPGGVQAGATNTPFSHLMRAATAPCCLHSHVPISGSSP